jgi:hypothetical protein
MQIQLLDGWFCPKITLSFSLVDRQNEKSETVSQRVIMAGMIRE